MPPLYLQDLPVGWSASSGPYLLTREEMVEFARRWDPRPFHIDEEAAGRSHFGGLVACGVHLMAIRSRLVHERRDPIALVAGLGSESLELPHPGRPGDELVLTSTCLEARRSRSRPDRGIVRLRDVLCNQRGEPVLELISKLMVFARPA